MASADKQLKGILKKATSGEQSGVDALLGLGTKPKVDARQVAIQHAQILQNRKDLESQILNSVILLSEYPQVRGDRYHSAANPAPSDVVDFKRLVRLFQPSDYDALIEERNVNGLCGYALCAQPRPTPGKGGQWKLASTGIVQRKEVEKWCSKSCAKRALYVKVQLNETAAWERAGILDIQIDLLDEQKPSEDPAAQAARELDRLKLQDERKSSEDSAALALERGDGPKIIPSGLLKDKIREKETRPPRQGVSFGDDKDTDQKTDSHLLLEGYKPKDWNGKILAKDREEEQNTPST